jgi:hypothetical protein
MGFICYVRAKPGHNQLTCFEYFTMAVKSDSTTLRTELQTFEQGISSGIKSLRKLLHLKEFPSCAQLGTPAFLLHNLKLNTICTEHIASHDS